MKEILEVICTSLKDINNAWFNLGPQEFLVSEYLRPILNVNQIKKKRLLIKSIITEHVSVYILQSGLYVCLSKMSPSKKIPKVILTP